MSTPENDRLIEQYIHTLNTMTSTQMAHRFQPVLDKDVAFRDPRLSAAGPDGVAEAMRSLFDGMIGIIFRATDVAWGQDGHTVYIRWDRLLKLQGGGTQAYTGITELMIGTNGKIKTITDHWDAQDHVIPAQGIIQKLFKR